MTTAVSEFTALVQSTQFCPKPSGIVPMLNPSIDVGSRAILLQWLCRAAAFLEMELSSISFPLASRQQYRIDTYLLLYVQSWTPHDGRKDRPKHVVLFQSKTKFWEICASGWFYCRNTIQYTTRIATVKLNLKVSEMVLWTPKLHCYFQKALPLTLQCEEECNLSTIWFIHFVSCD